MMRFAKILFTVFVLGLALAPQQSQALTNGVGHDLEESSVVQGGGDDKESGTDDGKKDDKKKIEAPKLDSKQGREDFIDAQPGGEKARKLWCQMSTTAKWITIISIAVVGLILFALLWKCCGGCCAVIMLILLVIALVITSIVFWVIKQKED